MSDINWPHAEPEASVQFRLLAALSGCQPALVKFKLIECLRHKTDLPYFRDPWLSSPISALIELNNDSHSLAWTPLARSLMLSIDNPTRMDANNSTNINCRYSDSFIVQEPGDNNNNQRYNEDTINEVLLRRLLQQLAKERPVGAIYRHNSTNNDLFGPSLQTLHAARASLLNLLRRQTNFDNNNDRLESGTTSVTTIDLMLGVGSQLSQVKSREKDDECSMNIIANENITSNNYRQDLRCDRSNRLFEAVRVAVARATTTTSIMSCEPPIHPTYLYAFDDRYTDSLVGQLSAADSKQMPLVDYVAEFTRSGSPTTTHYWPPFTLGKPHHLVMANGTIQGTSVVPESIGRQPEVAPFFAATLSCKADTNTSAADNTSSIDFVNSTTTMRHSALTVHTRRADHQATVASANGQKLQQTDSKHKNEPSTQTPTVASASRTPTSVITNEQSHLDRNLLEQQATIQLITSNPSATLSTQTNSSSSNLRLAWGFNLGWAPKLRAAIIGAGALLVLVVGIVVVVVRAAWRSSSISHATTVVASQLANGHCIQQSANKNTFTDPTETVAYPMCPITSGYKDENPHRQQQRDSLQTLTPSLDHTSCNNNVQQQQQQQSFASNHELSADGLMTGSSATTMSLANATHSSCASTSNTNDLSEQVHHHHLQHMMFRVMPDYSNDHNTDQLFIDNNNNGMVSMIDCDPNHSTIRHATATMERQQNKFYGVSLPQLDTSSLMRSTKRCALHDSTSNFNRRRSAVRDCDRFVVYHTDDGHNHNYGTDQFTTYNSHMSNCYSPCVGGPHSLIVDDIKKFDARDDNNNKRSSQDYRTQMSLYRADHQLDSLPLGASDLTSGPDSSLASSPLVTNHTSTIDHETSASRCSRALGNHHVTFDIG